jgi:hypothetical protein
MRYFLITYFRKAGGQIDEQVKVAKKVRSSDIQTCNVIMDFGKKNIDKCIIEGKKLDTDWDKMYTYYQKIYPAIFERLEKEAPIEMK